MDKPPTPLEAKLQEANAHLVAGVSADQEHKPVEAFEAYKRGVIALGEASKLAKGTLREEINTKTRYYLTRAEALLRDTPELSERNRKYQADCKAATARTTLPVEIVPITATTKSAKN